MITAYVLLGLSICAVWLPAFQLGARKLAPWIVLFIASVILALTSDVLKPIAALELALFVACAAYSRYAGSSGTGRWPRALALVATGLLALVMAMHLLPGFNNPIVISSVSFSSDSAPYTQYLNFDKAAVGLILLAFLCSRCSTPAQWKEMLIRTWPVALITAITTLVFAWTVAYVKPDLKISSYTTIFLATNLLFTCVAEEAFFRGILQQKMADALTRFKHGDKIAIVFSAFFFGAAHTAGGPKYIILATLVGLGSAIAYARVKRIEAPIITHFTLNAVHFVFFSYPFLR
jgi:membrane protease YdiL (CAAX protease family)